MLRLSMSFTDEMASGVQEFLEKLIEPIFQATKITKISLRPRFMFDCADEVQQNVFTETVQGQMLHHDFLPSREDLIRWVYRLKARYKQLKTFILDLTYATLDGDDNHLADNTFLMLGTTTSRRMLTIT